MSSPDAISPPGKSRTSGATGWEALIPLDWDRLRRLTNEPVPSHLKRWWFSLGGTPAYLFLIQITTGILLTFYYQPTAQSAYESVARITNEISYGWFIRSIHKWSANLMIATLILHMLRTFFTGAYRHPRQLNWVFGVTLLLLTLGFGFTGYALVYEQLSYWGATVAANLTESVPLVGPPLATLIRGGPEITSATVTRLYLLHIGVLPALLIGALGLHLTFVRLHGVTEFEFEGSPGAARRPAFPFPGPVLAVVTGLGGLLAVLAAVSPAPAVDLIGYRLLPGTSRFAFLAIALVLFGGAYWLWKGRVGGLLIFLAAAVLTLAKLVRDLLLHEAANPALWLALTGGLLAFLALALIFHRRFPEEVRPDEPKSYNFFPDHALTELLIGTTLLVLLTLLALIFPAHMGVKANPQVTPDHIKPEWFFFFQFRLLKMTSLHMSVMLTGLILVILFTWPWIDRLLARLAPNRDLSVYIGIVGFLWFLTFTVWEAMVH